MKKQKSYAGRHDEFQFGTNPMKMTDFEKKLVMREREERENVRRKQILGMQGRDGGHFSSPYENFNRE